MCNELFLDSFSFTKETCVSYSFLVSEDKIGLSEILLVKLGFAEAVTGGKKMFSNISQNSNLRPSFFLNKVAGDVVAFLNIVMTLVLTLFMPLGFLKT